MLTELERTIDIVSSTAVDSDFIPLPLFSSYSKSTKAVIALVVISAIALGCSVLIAHFASYISQDTIIKWLLPTGLALLIFTSICMFAILIIMGTNKKIDLDGISGRTLVDAAKGK